MILVILSLPLISSMLEASVLWIFLQTRLWTMVLCITKSK
ncbi:hypothetical protein MTR67_015654 [Solanum verrucosum]|uniref:Uncharacterized protein n=1 Tax=Solanum verrucosum TaxID=315347 RepID=A0AAF0TKA5_SOLVR|nr:hypothetical protein MTR67_015654 [Solanum verrucosum]